MPLLRVDQNSALGISSRNKLSTAQRYSRLESRHIKADDAYSSFSRAISKRLLIAYSRLLIYLPALTLMLISIPILIVPFAFIFNELLVLLPLPRM
jgi:hypothetical protein